MKYRWLAVVIAAVGVFWNVQAMDGTAATIVYQMTAPGPTTTAGTFRLMISTVSNNSVVKQDTILKEGAFYFATLSFDGRRVAFYKDGAGVCVIDVDGNNLRTVAPTDNWGFPDREQSIYWPGTDGGKWIYYHKPCNSGCSLNGSGEIWKVNVDNPSENIKLYDYTPNCNDRGLFLKFSLSTDARYAVIHTNNQGSDCFGYSTGIIPHAFPPQSGNPRATMPSCESGCAYVGACNSALSTSGAVLWHFDGSHNVIYSWKWDLAANSTVRLTTGSGPAGGLDQYQDMKAWLPASVDMGGCLVYPKGTCNSDQIVSVLPGFGYGASHTWQGNNQVIVNWKDKEAVMPTSHRDLTDGCCVPMGTPFWNTDPGDFWLAGGPPGCYEDIDGNWVAVPGADVSSNRIGARRSRPATGVMSGAVEVYNLKGMLVGTLGQKEVHRASLAAGASGGVRVVKQSGQPTAGIDVVVGR